MYPDGFGPRSPNGSESEGPEQDELSAKVEEGYADEAAVLDVLSCLPGMEAFQAAAELVVAQLGQLPEPVRQQYLEVLMRACSEEIACIQVERDRLGVMLRDLPGQLTEAIDALRTAPDTSQPFPIHVPADVPLHRMGALRGHQPRRVPNPRGSSSEPS